MLGCDTDAVLAIEIHPLRQKLLCYVMYALAAESLCSEERGMRLRYFTTLAFFKKIAAPSCS